MKFQPGDIVRIKMLNELAENGFHIKIEEPGVIYVENEKLNPYAIDMIGKTCRVGFCAGYGAIVTPVTERISFEYFPYCMMELIRRQDAVIVTPAISFDAMFKGSDT